MAKRQISLSKEEELRLEVEDEIVTLVLKSGFAEIFGCELVNGKEYKFKATKFAVFTWHGAELELGGSPSVSYTSSETPMRAYINTHMALEQLRQEAADQGLPGPRVLVVGPPDSGKTTTCLTLLNYACKLQWHPLYLNLDPKEGHIGVPGCVGATIVTHPVDILTCFADFPPILFHYGHLSSTANKSLYKSSVQSLASAVHDKLTQDLHCLHSGFFANLPTCDVETIEQIAQALQANVVLVVDNERLLNEVKRKLEPSATCVKIPKSGGIVTKDEEARMKDRTKFIHEYFYGYEGLPYSPHCFSVSLKNLLFWKVGAPPIPASCLPIGTAPDTHETQLVEVRPTLDALRDRILALVGPGKKDNIFRGSILGFVCVQGVERNLVTVLSPAVFPLPSQVLLLTDIKFNDHA